MSASRKARFFVLFGLVAAMVIGLSVSSADAGCHSYGGYGHGGYNIHVAHYQPVHYQPIVKYIQKPYVYPVLLYDCYGQPYYSWQTSYSTVPVSYLP
jgi:hypothetical protein